MDTIPKLFLLISFCAAVNSFLFFPTSTEPKLAHYNVDKNAVSVSGISSGAAMAVQFHVALSSKVMGLGVMAGVPYGCAGMAAMTVALCMTTPSLIATDLLVGVANSAALVGTIDATSHMRNDRVFVYHGMSDSIVHQEAGKKIVEFYEHFIPDHSNIGSKFNLDSQHGVPTLNYGNPCKTLGNSYLLNCHYSAAFHILNHIYGGHLVEPTTSTQQSGHLLKFDQTEFFYWSTPGMYSMDTIGYVYVPSGCASKTTKCKLHIAFHGCEQGVKTIGEDYVRHGGYNEAGELNNIIILYPQLIKTLTNPHGCWDWFGYTGIFYGTKEGFQITAVRRMMERVTG